VFVACLVGASALADPVQIAPKEVFEQQQIGGGIANRRGIALAPAPGLDQAFVDGVAVGGLAGTLGLTQLGGGDAGVILQTPSTVGGAVGSGPTRAFRVNVGGTGPTDWVLGGLDGFWWRQGNGIRTLSVESAPGNPTTDGAGNLRFAGLDPTAPASKRFQLWELVANASGGYDVGVVATIADPIGNNYPLIFPIPDGTNFYVFEDPGVYHGDFANPDAGVTSAGSIAFQTGWSIHLYDSSTSPYLVVLNDSNTFEVYALGPASVSSMGQFTVLVDGTVCQSCSASSWNVIRDGFPGYPQGALLLVDYGSAGDRYLVDWKDIATALGLTVDARLSTAGLVDAPQVVAPDGGGGSGGGGGGNTGPLGPPIGAASNGTGCSAVGSVPGAWGLVLVFLVLLGRAATRPSRR
jgi:hypothetical protein